MAEASMVDESGQHQQQQQSQQQYKCINVDSQLESSCPNALLNWINVRLQSNIKRIEHLCTGAAYAQLVDLLFPGLVPLNEIIFSTNLEHEYVNNFRIVQTALKRVGCDIEIPVNRLVKGKFEDHFEFLRRFKIFFDANHTQCNHSSNPSNDAPLDGVCDTINSSCNSTDHSKDEQLVVACLNNKGRVYFRDDGDADDYEDDESDDLYITYLDRSWSRKILELVGNKARLMESFSWLSTVGGGYSALGERDAKFSMRAGALSLGQQLHLAELLGDERLKVMCHLFAALAALQLDNKYFCINYIHRVILPSIAALPYRDPILLNILRHLCFRIGATYAVSNTAIEDTNRKTPVDLQEDSKQR